VLTRISCRPAALIIAPCLLALSLVSVDAAAQTRFRFPANDPKQIYFKRTPTIHVDHDPAKGEFDFECKDYQGRGFPWCYDGHKGTDYLLIYDLATMDANDVEVVAGADGEVIEAVDGNYDRCHADGTDVSCDGHPMRANIVGLRHADGIVSRYVHLKKGSVKVKVGDKVSCGDVLGYVGSSGRSAFAHLHFQVQDAQGETIDPYAGSESQSTSYWITQVGPTGWPDDLCPGEQRPDAGAAIPDAGPTGDSGAPGDGSLAEASSGCALAAGTNARQPPLALVVLGLCALAALRRRRSAA
jgi:MYXO-CTERM domain-containing protein